ncbi:5-(carboxyamino)imidazole ribonucleotide synthase [Sphingorhabdus arenilitoris]|uniref:N5-carboxyaminoimidazole ribonucleotide synthase n=1 Tax=Sphingorhabdus arenilitoris TaxID=1490041 RepID=A0ABV8RCP8_9SPHN
MTALSPGSTIGILGGGQLGRMMAAAAAQLGYRCHIYAPEADSVAAELSAAFTCAAYDDLTALEAFAKSCDIVTYEFENVPAQPLKKIIGKAALRPGVAPLEISQDRVAEKNFAESHGGKAAAFMPVKNFNQLADAIDKIGTPAIAKTIRMGYDGKGQARLRKGSNLEHIWHDLGRQPIVVEALVEFDAEFSVILVRGADGEIRFWDSARNSHEGGILAQSTVPAGPMVESQVAKARILASKIAEALDYVGVMTCEFFASSAGPIFNEMAPRVHNTGHWTIEGATTSQFENHIRAICGLPLGDTSSTAERVEMHNLIGTKIPDIAKLLSDDEAHVHLYGKGQAKPGRKMGHVTRLYR